MKTILVLTDFSINADYVGQYALKFARAIGANLLLCNIYDAPANDESDRLAWPMRACEENSINDLGAQVAQLKTRLDKEMTGGDFKPEIEQYSAEGSLSNTIKQLAVTDDLLMAVTSTHGANKLSGYFTADHAWDIVDNAAIPVMVIPYQARFKPFRTIAFATLMNHTDIDILKSLTGLAKYSNAGIVVANITAEQKEENKVKRFFNQVPAKIDYPGILYHNIMESDVARGLKKLCAHIGIDLLVMVHQRDNFFERVFGGSVTRKMMGNPGKPLLIFPGSTVKGTLSVF